MFSRWFDEAKQKEVNDPNAMNLATTSKNLKPNSRIVLLKSFDEKGFVFYTNAKSKKGNSIISNPYVALNFYWKSLFRQIRIEGKAKLVSENQADVYFNTRSKESKIGSWASQQSRELADRKELKEKYREYSNKFRDGVIPRPPHWTGFRVEPTLFEFWQQMPFRLHDRVEYKKRGKIWLINRLYP